ncbi:urea carboxylase [Xylaria curta]|nr:urea carboxylase [Xylaria curta]
MTLLTVSEWRTAQITGGGLQRLLSLLQSQRESESNAWIALATDEDISRQWEDAEAARLRGHESPLFGVPFAAKDNIDAVGFPTSAACPGFAPQPAGSDATVIARLKMAGAILIGKTNMDQFATGLVGTRSPFGAVPNSFDPARVSGGSSSGSAVVVATGVVPFSLGTDTAGSGRVPAGLNNIVGLKPTRGAISTTGVVPACRTLDCVSIFALIIDDAETVLSIAEGQDAADAYSRARPHNAVENILPLAAPRVAICNNPPWVGRSHRKEAYDNALLNARKNGFYLVTEEFDDLFELASLLYEGPWVAERYAAIKDFIESRAEDLDPVVRSIILQANKFTAADLFMAQYRREGLTVKIKRRFAKYDAILVPTAPTFPSLQDVAREPVRENSLLGTYTNFVNFMDWSALSIPAGFGEDELPFGITLISSAWDEPKLLALGRTFISTNEVRLGATSRLYRQPSSQLVPPTRIQQRIKIAVVGAHLSGFPLNSDLVCRDAKFIEATRTAARYQLFALPVTEGAIRKPGLKRVTDEQQGKAIEVEVWDLPASRFADFFRTIPPPLGLGSVELDSGSYICGFICEPAGLQDATDISRYGGWRAFCASLKKSVPAIGTPEESQVKMPKTVESSEHVSQMTLPKDVRTILVANRGEIAVRIIKTIQKMGLKAIAIFSAPDATAQHVQLADVAEALSGNTVTETYLSITQILDLAKRAKADAIIPGYGFLSENADFAAQVEAAGLIWIGPTPEQIHNMGLKHLARNIARDAGVPIVPGTTLLTSMEDAVREAEKIGYPVMVKSTAGGGGIGIRVAWNKDSLRADFESVKRTASSSFGNTGVFLERYIECARHVEVQILGDGKGTVMALGDRDCSLQRRNQKVIEECPAVFVPQVARDQIQQAAVNLATSVKYRSVGTVEFIYDVVKGGFYFLEVNSRLQVEHPVTEEVMGLDLVESMIQIASGDFDFERLRTSANRHLFSIEARIYAESPLQNFRPSPGKLLHVSFPEGIRIDTWVTTDTEVSSLYDPMIAKFIATAETRQAAIDRLLSALDSTVITGVETNLDYVSHIIATGEFGSGNFNTETLDKLNYQINAIEVLDPGSSTAVQDYPGRMGYWHIGIPPSGPMDDYSFRLANILVGNEEGAAGLECIAQGPTLLFHRPCAVAVVGAPVDVRINGEIIDSSRKLLLEKGAKLSCGIPKAGYRYYIAFQGGGIQVPYLYGSRSTFALGHFGGHNGSILATSDLLRLGGSSTPISESELDSSAPIPRIPIPTSDQSGWKVAVVPGPHGCPDFFTPEAYAKLFTSSWTLHYNSNRSGIRLKGPSPEWARPNGGLAGLHPSNIHDSPYAIGSVSFTGDEAVVLTRDGPSLGGFVVFATVIQAEMWKFGQMRPGDKLQFIPVAQALGVERLRVLEKAIASFSELPEVDENLQDEDWTAIQSGECPRLTKIQPDTEDSLVCRPFGDSGFLLEFGDYDGFNLRQTFRIMSLIRQHELSPLSVIEEISPGVRAVLVTITPKTPLATVIESLLSQLRTIDDQLPTKLPSRQLRLPFVFDDPVSQTSVDRYAATIRSSAPYLPRNVEFLRMLNFPGQGEDAVKDVLQSAAFLVLGLGDVFMGSPCAVPLDPRHRLFGTKYNPSRSFTPRCTVGIGGQYMCIYATDSPGGYQLVGRTVPIWNDRHMLLGQHKNAAAGETAWMFRPLDRISFYPISKNDLDDAVSAGRWQTLVSIKDDELSLAEYEEWLSENHEDIERVTEQRKRFVQDVPFYEELLKPFDDGLKTEVTDCQIQVVGNEIDIDGEVIKAGIPGRCFRVEVNEGDNVSVGDVLVSHY